MVAAVFQGTCYSLLSRLDSDVGQQGPDPNCSLGGTLLSVISQTCEIDKLGPQYTAARTIGLTDSAPGEERCPILL